MADRQVADLVDGEQRGMREHFQPLLQFAGSLGLFE
jgi:hypothetical protein